MTSCMSLMSRALGATLNLFGAFQPYLRGDRLYTILFRTVNTDTLVTHEQRGDPHLLVLPLRHITTILDLTVSDATDLMMAVREAASTIDQSYSKPGIAIWQNNGVPTFHAGGISHASTRD